MLVGAMLCGVQTGSASSLVVSKRDNTVYVTVTEFRYVPVVPQATASGAQEPAMPYQPPHQQQAAVPPAPNRSPVASPVPALAVPATSPMGVLPSVVPIVLHTEAPVRASASNAPAAGTLQPLSNNMLTFTSYAGLLSTVAPAFYPSSSTAVILIPLSSPVASPAAELPLTHVSSHVLAPASVLVPTSMDASVTPISLSLLSTTKAADAPTSVHPVTPWSTPTAATPPEPLPLHRPATTAPSATMATLTNSMESVVTTTASSYPTQTAASHKSTTDGSSSDTESSSISEEKTKATTSTITSTEVTVSTTTTTRGSTTHTTTSVGSDGTTTVLTQYPTSTQIHTTIRTSGPHPGISRGHLSLRHGGYQSAFESISDMLVAVSGALILPGVMFLLAT
ncbi:hypothetical protein EDD11_008046 [Mortierella claussenii]|nr:hypothetical protein EDD11_008046 [Mortierella claussenii]